MRYRRDALSEVLLALDAAAAGEELAQALELDPQVADRLGVVAPAEHPRLEDPGLLAGRVDVALAGGEQERQQHVHPSARNLVRSDRNLVVIALQSLCTSRLGRAQEVTAMASITIRNLDDDVKARLRVRAAGRGHSMEEEARQILREAVESEGGPTNLAAAFRDRFAPLGGVELELPPRQAMREPPRFE